MRVPLNDTTPRAAAHTKAVTQTSTIGTTIRRDRILLSHVKSYLGQGDECKYSYYTVKHNGKATSNAQKNDS
eukprot:scaffold23103_cov76-Skeletonema_dohrnii-CCMP3373.AAC.3